MCLKYLLKTELVAILWLLASSALFAAIAAGSAVGQGFISNLTGVLSGLVLLIGIIFLLGFIPVVLFGAPIYAWMGVRGKARWWSSLAIGLVPGIAMLPFEVPLALCALAVGPVVALLTHGSMRRGYGPSFKKSQWGQPTSIPSEVQHMRDIDVIIKELVEAWPDIVHKQLKVLHPADEDGLWFFTHPNSTNEVQLESDTGQCPFLCESNQSTKRYQAVTILEAVSLVEEGLGLMAPTTTLSY